MKFSILYTNCLRTVTLAVLAAAMTIPAAVLAQPTTDGAFYCTGDDANYNPYAVAATGRLYTYVSATHAYAAMVVDPSINDNVFAKKKYQLESFVHTAYMDSAGWPCKDSSCNLDGDETDPEHTFKKLYDSDKNVWEVSCGTTFTWAQDVVEDTDDDSRFWSFAGGEADFFSSHLGSDGSGTPPAGIVSMSSTAWNMNQSTWDVSFGGIYDSLSKDGKDYISPPGFLGGANGYSTCDTRYNWEWRIVLEINFPLASCSSPISLWVSDAHNSPEKNDPDSTSVCTVNCELPVELVSFTAIEENGDIQLRWSTASETDNAGFAIEHAINKGFWKEIDFVEGAGTSRAINEYSYRVLNVEPGKHTFRLKQVDLDGSFEYSASVEVAVEVPNAYVLEAAYPNPFNPQSTIRFAIKNRSEVTMAMYDATGREVRTLYEGIPEPNEMHEVRIDGAGLPSGIYLVRLSGDTFVASQSVTLIK